MLRVLQIGHRVVATQLDKAFVERVRNHVMVVDAGLKEPEEERLKIDSCTHAAKFEIPEPQFAVRELRIDAVTVQEINWGIIHVRLAERVRKRWVDDGPNPLLPELGHGAVGHFEAIHGGALYRQAPLHCRLDA